MIKVAFIKEACYQDLWIGDNNDTSSNLVRSSLQRTGLFNLLCTLDFISFKSFVSLKGNSPHAQYPLLIPILLM